MSSGGSAGPRRPSRWGAQAPPPAAASQASSAHPDRRSSQSQSQSQSSSSKASPTPSIQVSDQDAIQALLSQVAAKEHEKQEAAAARQSNDSKRRPPSSDARDGSKRQRSSGDDDKDKDKKESYYGPTGHDDEDDPEAAEKTHKPDFGLSGALAKDTSRSAAGGGSRMYKGILLKFQEPPEARAPNTHWRLYVYKKDQLEQTLHVSKQSAYLIGRSSEICDIHTAHPSTSTQHAVLQYRAVPVKSANASNPGQLQCLPYLLDLESTNGTFINGVRLDPARYYQLQKKDVLTFGGSTREYVLLC
jgi:smad nuclear-interacting protein 1